MANSDKGAFLVVRKRGTRWQIDFGDGSDGDVTTSGNVNLARDMYYKNLTIDTGPSIYTRGYKIFVQGEIEILEKATEKPEL